MNRFVHIKADYEYLKSCTGFLGYSLNGIFSEASGMLLWQLPLCIASLQDSGGLTASKQSINDDMEWQLLRSLIIHVSFTLW